MLGYRPDGRPDQRSVYGRTRQEVAQRLADLAAEAGKGMVALSGAQTVGSYLLAWFAHHRRFGGRDGTGLRPNTVRDYETLLRRHIIPALGNIPLAKLSPSHLRELYQRMVAAGLSTRRAQQAHRLLHGALAAAVQEGLIPRNPAAQVADKPRAAPPEHIALTRDQAAAVLREVQGTRYYLPFLLAVTTGMRRGEIMGLRWQHIDLAHGLVHVREQWQKGEDGQYASFPVKTRSGVRDIPIPPDVVAALRRHRAESKVVSLEGYVFARPEDGRPWQPGELDHAFARVRRRIGLPEKATFHCLRRSLSTWLAEAGVNPKVIAQLLGHADVSTTLNIYQSVTQRMAETVTQFTTGFAQADSY